MKRYLMAATMVAFVVAGWAAKAFPGKTIVKQGDGTKIVAQLHGDEYAHYYTAADGAILTMVGNGLYVAKQDADGNVVASGVLAHEPGERGLVECLAVDRQDRKSMMLKMMEMQNVGRQTTRASGSNSLFPSTGSPKAIVILVEFSDLGFKVDNPKEQFEKYLNSSEKLTDVTKTEYNNFSSVKQYFTDMSFGKFTPQFDLYGPYKVSGSFATYGKNDNMALLFTDACSAADADIDFSQYDADGDGKVDLVYIIYAGYGENYSSNNSNYIWPQSGKVSLTETFDGKRIERYGVNNELFGEESKETQYGPRLNGIGLFCHEFCHCLGLPDMYPTGFFSNAIECCNVGLGYYGLMDAGEYTYNGFRPTALTCWERATLGWTEIEELTEPCDVTLKTAERGGKAYKIVNPVNPDESYLIEQVERSDELWNYYVFADGMLVYHIDYDPSAFGLSFNNVVNNEVGHPRFYLVAADGLMLSDYYLNRTVNLSSSSSVNEVNKEMLNRYEGQYIDDSLYLTEAKGDPFPGLNNVTSFTDDSMMPAFWYTGGGVGKPLTDISRNSDNNVTFKFSGGETAVEQPKTDDGHNETYYSLDGKKVGDVKGKKGVYVSKGKKRVK